MPICKLPQSFPTSDVTLVTPVSLFLFCTLIFSIKSCNSCESILLHLTRKENLLIVFHMLVSKCIFIFLPYNLCDGGGSLINF